MSFQWKCLFTTAKCLFNRIQSIEKEKTKYAQRNPYCVITMLLFLSFYDTFHAENSYILLIMSTYIFVGINIFYMFHLKDFALHHVDFLWKNNFCMGKVNLFMWSVSGINLSFFTQLIWKRIFWILESIE